MDRKKQLIYTTSGILAICLLFSLAIIFPEYYTSYTDKKLLNKTEYIDVSYNTYEVTYSSFAEKLNAIGKAENNGNSITQVKINSSKTFSDYKKINKIIQKEFNDLYTCGVLGKKFRLYAKRITLCDKYMMYPSDSKNNLKGITYIKVVYKTKKGKIKVYIDEEYQKIYELEIPFKMYEPAIIKYCTEYKGKYGKTCYPDSSISDSTTSSYILDKAYYDSYYSFIEAMIIYYDIFKNNILVSQNTDTLGIYPNAHISFTDGTTLEISRIQVNTMSGRTYIKLGINLDYMIK